MDNLISLINTVGFPIVACIYMAENNKKLTKLMGDVVITLKGIDIRLENLERSVENNE